MYLNLDGLSGTIGLVMRPSPVHFVEVRFTPLGETETPISLVVVHDREAGRLSVWLPPNWERGISGTTEAYLADITQDWCTKAPDDCAAVLDYLCRISQGAMRAVRYGNASRREVELMTVGLLLVESNPGHFAYN